MRVYAGLSVEGLVMNLVGGLSELRHGDERERAMRNIYCFAARLKHNGNR